MASPSARASCCHRTTRAGMILLLTVMAPFGRNAWSAPVTTDHAAKAVRGWLKQDAAPLQTTLAGTIDHVDAMDDSRGQRLYHIVYLNPSGFVIVSADDEIEPIIGFVSQGIFDPSPANPLGALVSRDMAGRLDAVRKGRTQSRAAARERWQKLALTTDVAGPQPASAGSVSDLRVAPLVQSQWGQDVEYSAACYNYYTPNHYPAGCVATAMAQLMRYHRHPTAGIGRNLLPIFVDGGYTSATTRGGDGLGGPYAWNLMPTDPGSTITAAERQAIGALCYDAGVSVNMSYTASASGATNIGSRALTLIFGYGNSIRGSNGGLNIPLDGLIGMINPNLDAAYPVLVGIQGAAGKHAVVCDGYGYSGATLYHHLNMGWNGIQNAWYNLPDIDSSPAFTAVFECGYNIFPSGNGEIISGRIVDPSGAPLIGAAVTAERTGGGTYAAVTDDNGIYALAKVPGACGYTVAVAVAGYTFTSQNVTVGTSSNYAGVSGNRWAVDFTGQPTSAPPVASDGEATVHLGTTATLVLQATDDGLPAPPAAVTCILTSLPSHGILQDPSGTAIETVPYTLVGGGAAVLYTPADGYAGPDTFTFKASDGGIAPLGGDSNTAVWSLAVERLAGDINGNGHVDVSDLLYFVDSFGLNLGEPGFDARCDSNSDDIVDVVDLLTLVENWGL